MPTARCGVAVIEFEVTGCGLPSDVVTVRTVETYAEWCELMNWLGCFVGCVLGLDIETNALDPWHPDFAVRTVQVASDSETWVIICETEEMRELAAMLIWSHDAWVAHFAEADIRFAMRGLPKVYDGNAMVPCIRFGEKTPHVADSQVTLAMYDPRTVTTHNKKDRIPLGVPRLKGLKDNSERLISPVLRRAEEEMERWFREIAPVGFRQGKQKMKAWGFANADVRNKIFLAYAGLDAVMGLRLFLLCRNELKKRGQWERCRTELMIQWAIDQATFRGMQVDGPYARWLYDQLVSVVDRHMPLLAKYRIARSAMGPSVGLAFSSRGITSPVIKDGKQSWDKTAMAALAEHEHPKVRELAQAIRDVRRATKFATTYVLPMLAAVEHGDGAMHASIRAIGTVTTRMSAQKTESAGPLQQLPKKDTRVRAAVRCKRGWVKVTADFEQGEPFTMAALSGDQDYLRDLTTPVPELGKPDINSVIAKLVYGDRYDPGQGKKTGTIHYHMRQNAKAGWLLCCYGGAAAKLEWTLRQNLPAELHSAISGQKTLDTWHAAYPVFWACADALNNETVIQLDSGHRVPLWDRFWIAEDGTLHVKSRPSRLGLNAKTQGTQADLLDIAILRLIAWGWSWAFEFALHDELVLEVPEPMAEVARDVLKQAMTVRYRGVTVSCEASIEGRTWMPQPTEFTTDDLPEEEED